jgi:hypothetical protein
MLTASSRFFPIQLHARVLAKASPPSSPFAIQAFALNATNHTRSSLNAALALQAAPCTPWVNLHLSNPE